MALETVNAGAVSLAAALVFSAACRSGRPSEAPPVAEPASRSLVQGAPPAGTGRSPEQAPTDQGMPPITVVLDDPRLAAVRDSDAGGDDAAAAREMDRLRAAFSLEATQACAWSYVAGRLHYAAGEANEAAAAFGAASGKDLGADAVCPLASYARLRQAQALVRAGRASEALTALQAVGDDVAAQDEVKLTLADALAASGDRAGAVVLWRSLLATRPHGQRWVDISMQLARSLLDGVDGPPEIRASEALERATRVVVEAPTVADKIGADSVRGRAAAALKLAAPPALTVDERTREAQAWLDASQPVKARELADGALRDIPRSDRERVDVGCRAAIVRAEASPRGRAEEAADAWGAAIARCRGASDEGARATAAYQGGKASASAKRYAEALQRFAEVEEYLPTNRLADDARFRAALVVGDQGDPERSLSMLGSIADSYPDGDMAYDALFRVALARIAGHDFQASRRLLDRLLALPPGVLSWGSASRAEYFRARVAQLAGDVDDAKSRYVAIVARRPLSYPMLAAFARLSAMDDALARATLEEAVQGEPAGPFLTRRHPEFETPAFERFRRLLEVGEIDAARQLATASALLSDYADSEVVWTLAWLYNRAGAPDVGHAFSRARLGDYRSHWPAGRWRLPWEIAFPRPWEAVVQRESESAGVPGPLTWAIMREESAFNPAARSVANAVGLMQLMSSTAAKVAQGTLFASDDSSLLRPDVSIALGTRLLSQLRKSYPNRPELAVAAYNGGAVAVRRWLTERRTDDVDLFIERIPFDETRNYVKRVLASQAAYAYLYAPKSLDELITMFKGSESELAAANASAAAMDPPIMAPASPALAAVRARASMPTGAVR